MATPDHGSNHGREAAKHVQEYDQNGLPATILHWRKEPQTTCWTGRHIWNPLEDFFDHNGYTLFVASADYTCCLVPKAKGERRAPDEYHHVLPEDLHQYQGRFLHTSNKFCPATRKADGAHVMIQIICKAGQGQDELNILRYFSKGSIRSDPANHVIPLLDELHHLDMSFAVVPLLYEEPCNLPWFLNLSEALDAIHQTFESLAFIHKHLTAHRDIGSGEFICNFGGSHYGPQFQEASDGTGPFRSLFPCRYYLIDFETAIQFPGDSLPSVRLVRGMATLLNHGTEDPKHYGKALPPEWTSGQPYSPFASDCFQVAGMWKKLFFLKGQHTQGLVNIWERMMSLDPAYRPTMAEAVLDLSAYRQSLTVDQLAAPVQEYSSYRARHGKPAAQAGTSH